MVSVTLFTPGGGERTNHYADAADALLGLAATLTPEEVGRLRLDLHRVQLRLAGVAVTPFKGPPAGGGS